MTRHPEEGALQAHLDGELPAERREALERHLVECAPCRFRLIELEVLAGSVREALPLLDAPSPPGEGAEDAEWLGVARWTVRKKHASRRKAERQRRIAVAASVLLLLGAGIATAAPGSPFWGWWQARSGEEHPALTVLSQSEATAPVPQAASTRVDEPPDVAALAVPPADGRVSVSLEGVPGGTWIELQLVDGEPATIEAPADARFETGPGRIHVELSPSAGVVEAEPRAGDAPSPEIAPEPGPGIGLEPRPTIRIGIPGAAVQAEVRVNGAVIHPGPASPAAAGEPRRWQVPLSGGPGTPGGDGG